jgi:DNA repair protein RecO (recombination protein O)
MEWAEEGIVLGTRRHGETSAVAEILTRSRGRHAGLVRGGRSRQMRPVLQPGNRVEAHWRARIEDQLGTYTVEPVSAIAARVIDQPRALLALGYMTSLLMLLAERDPHPRLYDAFSATLERLLDASALPLAVLRFEQVMLDEFGFGLDLAACAVTGQVSDLAYVSPRTGRAVSVEAGAPYAERLLRLPACLLAGAQDETVSAGDVAAGFALTGHFLDRHLFDARSASLREMRARLVERLAKSVGRA